MKRILVTGSRKWTDKQAVFRALDEITKDIHPSEVLIIHGDAAGADQFADEWAKTHRAPRAIFPAHWGKHGNAAGPIRNRQMNSEMQPDIVVAFPLEDSKGTWDMVRVAQDAGRAVSVYT